MLEYNYSKGQKSKRKEIVKMRKITNVTSNYNAKRKMTTVCIDTNDDSGESKVTYTGHAIWNGRDDFNPIEAFKVAYERAFEQMPKPGIIERCGGLKDGDWVCAHDIMINDSIDRYSWGFVHCNVIYYMYGLSNNWDRTDSFDKYGYAYGSKITEIIRPTSKNCPVTLGAIRDYVEEKIAIKGCLHFKAD